MKKIKSYIQKLAFLLVLTMVISNTMLVTPTVAQAATLKISHKEVSIPVNTTKQLLVSGTSKKITWTSSNKKVAMVNTIGLITGKSEGIATITASVNGKQLKCKTTVYEPWTLSQSSITINAGRTDKLEVIGASKTPTWSSSNNSIAKVSKYGTVTGVKKGTAVITASVGIRKLTTKVTVLDSIAISDKSLSLAEGQTKSLKIKGITYRSTWKSSNTSIAIVSAYGTVTALKAGKATITAYVDGVKQSCTVNVTKAAGISEKSFVLEAGKSTSSLKPPIITPTPDITAAPVITEGASSVKSSSPDDNLVAFTPYVTTDNIPVTDNTSSIDNPTPTDSTTVTTTITPIATPTVIPSTTLTATPTDTPTITPTTTPTVTPTTTPTATPSATPTTTPTTPPAPIIHWSSSDTKVAVVSDNGIVKGLKPGTAIITASYGNQKYTYQAIVLSNYNAFVKKAPFSATTETFDKLNYLLPRNWNVESHTSPELGVTIASPNNNDSSNIIISIYKTDSYAPAYSTVRKDLKSINSLNNLNDQFEYMLMHSGYHFTIKNYKQSDYMSDIGKVLKTQFTVKIDGQSLHQTVYDFFIGTYFIEMVVTEDPGYDYDDVQKMGEYILNSMTINN